MLVTSSSFPRFADMYNGKEMDGRVVQVRPDARSKTTASSTRVFVGNLAWGVTWMDLKDHFRAAGDVVHATVFKDGERSKVCVCVCVCVCVYIHTYIHACIHT